MNGPVSRAVRPGSAIGTISGWTDLQQEYADFICKSTDIDLSGLKVVHDGANGSASLLGPEILERLGAEVIAIHNKPNGININETVVPLTLTV